jgi:hypothetical protein
MNHIACFSIDKPRGFDVAGKMESFRYAPKL